MRQTKKNILDSPELLARFIQQVLSKPDTPSIIQLVASDSDFLALCGAVTNASPAEKPFFDRLAKACHRNNTDFTRLKSKLDPVAHSLGLAGTDKDQVDYYDLLGIASDADEDEIKKAYRTRARQVHPDINRDGREDNSQAFVELNQAYQTLMDPVMRRRYDRSRQHIDLWYERPPENQKPNKRRRHIYLLAGFFLFLVVAAFVFDYLFQETAITGSSFISKQRGGETDSRTTVVEAGEGIFKPGAFRESSEEEGVQPSSTMEADPNQVLPASAPSLSKANASLLGGQKGAAPYEISIYYDDPEDRAALLRLSAFLEALGYRPPSLVRLTHHSFGIHYFNAADKEGALILQKQVDDFFSKELGLKGFRPVIENCTQDDPAASEGRIELWIDKDFRQHGLKSEARNPKS